MCKPHLGVGEIESGGEMKKPLVIARIADPGLMSDEVAGESVLTDFGQSGRGSNIAKMGQGTPIFRRKAVEIRGALPHAEGALSD